MSETHQEMPRDQESIRDELRKYILDLPNKLARVKAEQTGREFLAEFINVMCFLDSCIEWVEGQTFLPDEVTHDARDRISQVIDKAKLEQHRFPQGSNEAMGEDEKESFYERALLVVGLNQDGQFILPA